MPALSEGADGGTALPDTGDIEVDLKSVPRATVEEFGDPAFDRLLRGVGVEIAQDAGLAAEYRERLSRPMEEAKKARSRGARAGGQLLPAADLDLILDMLYAPIFRRWLHRGGPLDAAFADSASPLLAAPGRDLPRPVRVRPTLPGSRVVSRVTEEG
ncbi:TetR-like C-terminal domain-containing protein [Streptomyces sp. ZYX-F-203]